MHQYSIIIDDETIGVRSDADLMPIFNQWKELLHLAGVSVAVNLGGDHEFILEYTNAQGKFVLYSDKRVNITIPIDEIGSGEILLYASLPFLEVLHQRKTVVTLHAAAVNLNGKAILLLGKAGAGKTSITLSLCRNHRARLIGNDIVKVGLDGGKVIACSGSKYFFLREESIKRNIPDLLSLFPQSTKDPWTHKIYCLPEQLGIGASDNLIPIVSSYLVHVDETMEDVYVTSADKMDTRLYLSENMSRYIRGTAIALFDNQARFLGYVPSFDTPDFFTMRVSLVEAIISTTGATYLSGNLQNVSQYIVSKAGV